MIHTALAPEPSNTIEHYRLVSALAGQERLCPQNIDKSLWVHGQVRLSAVAAAMDVPVVLATYYDDNGIQTFATHGLGLMNNLALFAATCNELCAAQAVAIPDTRTHKSLGALAKHWPVDDVCFLVGVPLSNEKGQRVGSLAVMDTSKAVASKGICFRSLTAFGKAIARNSRLPSEQLAA